MKIVEGGLPEDKAWRALVLLAPGEEIGISWQLGLTLAQTNSGELVAATIIPNIDSDKLAKARETLTQARKACRREDPVYTAVIQSIDYRKAVRELIGRADIDLLLASAETPGWQSLERMPCAIALIRGESYNPLRAGEEAQTSPTGQRPIRSILVPTSGGPNSAHALGYLLPLTNRNVEITALYVAPERLGPNEEALGRSRLRQTLNFIDAGDRIYSKLISAASVTFGITNEAREDYDIVMIGASRESSLDKALFGNIPDAVVRQCQKPVVLVREPTGAVGSFVRRATWSMQSVFPRLNLKDRTAAYVRIRRDARPDIDFYVLICLSSVIAAFGLLASSTAVVIGAMLVAPLMSPIAGTGLAIVLGDTRFLRLTLGAIFRGALLAMLMGFLVGLIPLKDPMTAEILSRTQPTLLDVGVAIFSGMAVAYALCRSEANAALPGVAIAAALVPPLATAGITLANGAVQEFGGAFLLFLTNFVAIASASALVFLILGFRPMMAQKERRAVRTRSARIAVAFLIIITATVSWTTYRLAQTSAAEARIREVADNSLAEITGAILVELEIGDLSEDVLQIDLIVRSPRSIPHSQVVNLQEVIATELQREIAMTLTIIPTTQLDPFVPPTLTPTATATYTSTPGPTATTTPAPSSTPTPIPSATATASNTSTPTATATSTPTATPTWTPTPPTAVVTFSYGLNMRSEASSEADLMAFLEPGIEVTLLDGTEINGEGSWQQIQYDGQVGWVLSDFLTRP